MDANNLAEGPEWRLLIAACRPERSQDEIRSLLQVPIDWNGLFALAENHGVHPLLHGGVKPFRNSIGPETFEKLESKHQSNIRRAMMLSRELIGILSALSENGIVVMPYKGVTLAELLYGDIALRQTGDIDLLIRPKDVAPARDALRALNYSPHLEFSARQEQAYLKSAYEYAFDAPAGRNLLEVQWAIQPRFYAVDLNTEELFDRSITASVAGRMIKTVSYEDLFLVLSLHAAKHAWAKLIWISDLARIIRMENLNWATIGAGAQRLRIRRILTLNLLLAHELFGVTIPFAAEEHVLEDGAEDLSRTIKAIILSGASFDVESLAYFRLMVRLRENVVDRARFVSRLILTPGPGEWASIQIPDVLFPVYRLVRFSRLAAKLARS